MINATGAARVGAASSGFRYVFQSAAPLSAYGAGALELARSLGLKRDRAARARRSGRARDGGAHAGGRDRSRASASARSRSIAAGSDDFPPQVARARAAGAEAWIAFGLPQDAAEMVKTFRKLGYAPRAVRRAGRGASRSSSRASGRTPSSPSASRAYDRARAHARQRRSSSQAYAKKWSAEPGAIAAEGYAAAKVLEEAVRRAGSFDQEKLREALAALETETPLGAYKVERSGAQVARAAAARADAARAARDRLARGARDGEMAAVSRPGKRASP